MKGAAGQSDVDPDGAAMNEQAPVAGRGLALVSAAVFLVQWLPGSLGPYGFFIDEFYYLACARHLAWGYVDHPPLSVAVLALVRAVAGDSLLAVRFVPSLLAAATVVATGLLARRLGAGPAGQVLAALCMACAAIPMVMFSLYSMNAIDILLWAIAFGVLVEIERRDAPRGWIGFGLVLGFGLLNKHTIALLPAALAVGMLITSARRHFLAPQLWLGVALATLMLLPNLLWQAGHGWPSLEFYANADLYKNNPTPPLEVVGQQVLFMNPFAWPVWLAGLAFLLGRGMDGRLRHVGWAYVILLLALALGQRSRPDRLAPAYSILFAAGAAVFDSVALSPGRRWIPPAAIAAVALGGFALAPIALPVLPPSAVAAYGARWGIVPQIEAGAGKRAALPQWLSDPLEWQGLADDVGAVVRSLPGGERGRVAIVAPSYGQAGALERLGHDLPPVFAVHNNYSLWGPPPDSLGTLVLVGFREEFVRGSFASVERAATHRCTWCTPWRNDAPIWVAREPVRPVRELWGRIAHFE